MSESTGNPTPQPDGTTTGTYGTATSAVSPAPPAVTPPTAGELAPATDWEKKFKGLQPVYQQLQERHKVLEQEKGALATQLTEAQGQIGLLRGELDTTKAQFTNQGDELTTLKEELGNYKLLERKTRLLREKAPQLLQFEKHIVVDVPGDLLDISLDQMTEEQLRQLDAAITVSIDQFSQVMADYVTATVQNQQAGITPITSPGRPSAEPNADELYKQMMAAAGTPKFAELQKLYTKAVEQQIGKPDQDGFWRPLTQ